MNTKNRVYPSQTNLCEFPLLSELGKKGIKRIIKWSLTSLGPHFVFDFSDLEGTKLSQIVIGDTHLQTKIGVFTNEGPLGATNYIISMNTKGEIWMWLQEEIEQLAPIFLASSPLCLAEIIDRFAIHLENIEQSSLENEWEEDWGRFFDDCKKIDPNGGSSYWASLAADYLDND